MESKKILVVGAGAVGQVYARHLLLSGANVTFLVREKYLADLQGGYKIYALNEQSGHHEGLHIQGYGLLTADDAIEDTQWDQVWLCVSSAALRDPWFPKLLERVGKASVVALQPGIEERDFFINMFPEDRLVHGIIPFISYPVAQVHTASDSAPKVDDGVNAYWIPPFSKMLFSGSPARRDEVLRLLVAGGLRARSHQDVSRMAAFSSAVLMSLMIGLEASGWSMGRFRGSKHIRIATQAAREALRIAARHHEVKPPWWRGMLGVWSIGLLMTAARKWMPLPIEEYFRFHFTKIGEQTRLYANSYLKLGQVFNLPTKAMAENMGGLQATQND